MRMRMELSGQGVKRRERAKGKGKGQGKVPTTGERVCKLSSSTKTAICTLHRLGVLISIFRLCCLSSLCSLQSLLSLLSLLSFLPLVPATIVVDDNFTCGFTLVGRNNKRGRKVCVCIARMESHLRAKSRKGLEPISLARVLDPNPNANSEPEAIDPKSL